MKMIQTILIIDPVIHNPNILRCPGVKDGHILAVGVNLLDARLNTAGTVIHKPVIYTDLGCRIIRELCHITSVFAHFEQTKAFVAAVIVPLPIKSNESAA